LSGADTTRICYHCKALCARGQKCHACGWPDPETQPKKHIAFLKRYIKAAEAAAKRAGIDTSKMKIGEAMRKIKAARR
jgi:ribosomal protein L22